MPKPTASRCGTCSAPVRSASFGLPMTYEQLLDTLEKSALALMKSHPGTYRGVGVCAPGLVNSQLQAIVFSPNLHLLDGQRPARDLAARLGLDYYANKNWLFTFGYEHQIRESSDAAFDMTRERFTVGAKLRF